MTKQLKENILMTIQKYKYTSVIAATLLANTIKLISANKNEYHTFF